MTEIHLCHAWFGHGMPRMDTACQDEQFVSSLEGAAAAAADDELPDDEMDTR
eukprot:COSAG01_NODE_14540_length_1440_cov_1.705444_3_plen_52_part_00